MIEATAIYFQTWYLEKIEQTQGSQRQIFRIVSKSGDFWIHTCSLKQHKLICV